MTFRHLRGSCQMPHIFTDYFRMWNLISFIQSIVVSLERLHTFTAEKISVTYSITFNSFSQLDSSPESLFTDSLLKTFQWPTSTASKWPITKPTTWIKEVFYGVYHNPERMSCFKGKTASYYTSREQQGLKFTMVNGSAFLSAEGKDESQ